MQNDSKQALDEALQADQAPEETTGRKKKKKDKPKKPLWQEILSWVLTLLAAVLIAGIIRTTLFELVKVEGESMMDTLTDKEIMFVTKTEYSSFWLSSPFSGKQDNEGLTKVTLFGNPSRFDVVICRYPNRGTTNFVKRVVGLPGDTVAVVDGYLYVNGERYEEPYINNEYRMYASTVQRLSWEDNAVKLEMLDDDGQVTRSYRYPVDENGFSLPESYSLLIQRSDGASEFLTTSGGILRNEDGALTVNGEAFPYDADKDTLKIGVLMNTAETTVPDGYYFVMGDHRNNSNDSRAVGAIPRSYIMGHVQQVIWPLGNWRAIPNGLKVTAASEE